MNSGTVTIHRFHCRLEKNHINGFESLGTYERKPGLCKPIWSSRNGKRDLNSTKAAIAKSNGMVEPKFLIAITRRRFRQMPLRKDGRCRSLEASIILC